MTNKQRTTNIVNWLKSEITLTADQERRLVSILSKNFSHAERAVIEKVRFILNEEKQGHIGRMSGTATLIISNVERKVRQL